VRSNQEIAAFISTARKYVGYTSELLGRNIFGERVGYQSQPWAGAFIDVCAREAGLLHLPSFTYTPAALAAAVRSGNISRTPQPGDIAIFAFSSNTASAFSAPHAGVVTDVRNFKRTGEFLTIEGNTEGPGPHQKKDGVYPRIRTSNEVIVFVRAQQPNRPARQLLMKILQKLTGTGRAQDRVELQTINEAASAPIQVRLQKVTAARTRNQDIERVQLALSLVTDLKNCTRGSWDAQTAAACANFQRTIGRVGSDASGTPDLSTLQRLSKETGLFTVTE
jgi:hypothetical protein